MIHTKKFLFLLSSLAALLLFSGLASAQQIVNCSSEDGRRHFCDVDTHGGVRLVKQRSDAACQEGYSWGYDHRGIWVDRGCRADFEVDERRGNWGREPDRYRTGGYGGYDGYHGDRGIQAISCSSDDMHRHYCPADTRGGVRLYQQRSDASCREGYSWGYDRRGIWVDHGCRGDFQTGLGR